MHIQHATNALEVEMLNGWDTSGTVNTRTDPISIKNKADTTAPGKIGKITVHIPMLAHHRLKDNTGMAGTADGDNRHYGWQYKFAGKISPIQRFDIDAQFFSYTFMPIQRFIEITLNLSRIVALPTIRYYSFWTCGRWPCMVHCECWSSMFDRIHVYL